MDTVSYSFSACSDGSVSYSVTCTGPDCDSLPDLFGSVCSTSGNTVTCSYNNDCSGSVDYVSSLQLSESNSTYYAVNRLSIDDCADVSFVVNGTSVLPLVTSSNSQCSTTLTSTMSSLPKSASTSAPTTAVASTSLKSAGPSSALTSQSAASFPSPSSTSGIQPNGAASTQTAPAGSISPSSPSATITVQQSSGAFRQSSRIHASFASFLPVLLLLLSLLTPTVAASGVYSDQLANQPSPFHERSSANSLAHLGRSLEPRGYVGPIISDVSTWYNQFQKFSSSQPDAVSNALSTIGTDILDLACQVFLDHVETGLIRQVLFKQDWQQCVALGESFQQELQLMLYFPNNTNPLGNGLAGHYLTVAVNTGVTLGVKAGCDLLFSELIQLRLGENPIDQTCNDWLTSLGLTPPAAITAGSGLPAGGGLSGNVRFKIKRQK